MTLHELEELLRGLIPKWPDATMTIRNTDPQGSELYIEAGSFDLTVRPVENGDFLVGLRVLHTGDAASVVQRVISLLGVT